MRACVPNLRSSEWSTWRGEGAICSLSLPSLLLACFLERATLGTPIIDHVSQQIDIYYEYTDTVSSMVGFYFGTLVVLALRKTRTLQAPGTASSTLYPVQSQPRTGHTREPDPAHISSRSNTKPPRPRARTNEHRPRHERTHTRQTSHPHHTHGR